MLKQKNNPIGVDTYIQALQNALYVYLKGYFGLTDGMGSISQYDSYDRCDRRLDISGSGQALYWYGAPPDYLPVMVVNDGVALTSFFDVKKNIKVGKHGLGWDSAEVDIIFVANIASIETLVTGQPAVNRYDEVLIDTITERMRTYGTYAFSIKEVRRGAREVLTEFSGQYKQNMIKMDMQPYAVFSIQMQLLNYKANATPPINY